MAEGLADASPGGALLADPDWDVLAASLNSYGINHLAPSGQPDRSLVTDPEKLFRALVTARAVRLQEAAIVLLITHPSLAAAALTAIDSISGSARVQAVRRYVVACCLQRMWRSRLQLTLGPQRLIPPAFLDELHLPPLELDDGRATLRALAEREEEAHGHNAWDGYASLMNLVLAQVELPGWGRRARAN